MTFDADRTRAYFDAYAEREWLRLEASLPGRAKYAVHRHVLEQYIKPGMRVLDIGSGPGRFAIDMVHFGARVTVADLSPVQLELARMHAAEALHGIESFQQLDVTDLSPLPAESYDAVVCIGGVLSYTRERHVDALHQLTRVVKPGGVVIVGVMNILGALRLIVPLDAAKVIETLDDHMDLGTLGEGVVYTRLSSNEFHQPIVLFTAQGIRSAIAAAGLLPIDMASPNPLLTEFTQTPQIVASEKAAAAMLALEVTLCRQPGLLDAGGHVIAVGRKP
jgi:2-polyprenyl-3-methyl-5-hydroxy-6-metoxy-1,4-benzoquinol methylase